MQRAALDEHGCNRATAAVEFGFDDGAFGRASRICLQIEDFRLQPEHFEQLVDIRFLGSGHFNVHHLAAHGFNLDLMLQQISAHASPVWRQAYRSC